MFGCWLGWLGAIAGVDEVAGFWNDMVSAWSLMGDSSCGLCGGGEPLGLRGCGILDMERNKEGRRRKVSKNMPI